MIQAILLAVWLTGSAQGAAVVEAVPDSSTGAVETAVSDSLKVPYRAAVPVVEYVRLTRAGGDAVTTDPYQRQKEYLVDIVLAIAAIFSLYMILQYRKASRRSAAYAPSSSTRVPRARPAAPKPEAVSKLPVTPGEQARHLRDSRMVHTAAIERLFKRL